MSEDTTPVLIGVAQVQQRITDPAEGQEPLALMIDAVRGAAADAGNPELLTRASSVRVVKGRWGYKNPAKAIAEEIGSPGAETALTQYGGNFVQSTVNLSCLDIQSGHQDIVIITGAECGNTQAKAEKAGFRPQWSDAPGTPDRMIGEDQPMATAHEMKMGLRQPIQWYPMFESAFRASRGESLPDHLQRISELWAGFSQVAAGNPHAWLRDPVSAEDIRTAGPRNRPISYPYSKYLNSNNSVDMGTALILTSVATAKKLSIPEAKWVYPHAGTDAHDTYAASNRDSMHASPAIRVAGRRALELAGLTPATLDHVDVYSCFPSAVQVGATEVGLGLDRPLTVTGGLTFNGGPLNNYVSHAIARMAEVLREQPGSNGLVTANGGYLTKHAFGVYSTDAPDQPFQHQDVQAEVDTHPTRNVAESHIGTATVEAYTVMYGPAGLDTAFMTCLTPDGDRALATTKDADVLRAMTEEEFCGREGKLNAEGVMTL